MKYRCLRLWAIVVLAAFLLTFAPPQSRARTVAEVAVSTVVNTMSFSPDGSLLAVTGDGSIRLYKAGSAKLWREVPVIGGAALVARWSPDGRYLCVLCGEGPGDGRMVALWRTDIWRPVAFRHLTDTPYDIEFVPHTDTVAVAVATGNERGDADVWTWDFRRQRIVDDFSGANARVVNLTASSDGRFLAATDYAPYTFGSKGNVSVWDVRTGRLVRQISCAPNEPAVWRPMSHRLAVALPGGQKGNDDITVLTELEIGHKRGRIAPLAKIVGDVEPVGYLPRGNVIAAGNELIRVVDGKVLRRFPVPLLAVSPRGDWVAGSPAIDPSNPTPSKIEMLRIGRAVVGAPIRQPRFQWLTAMRWWPAGEPKHAETSRASTVPVKLDSNAQQNDPDPDGLGVREIDTVVNHMPVAYYLPVKIYDLLYSPDQRFVAYHDRQFVVGDTNQYNVSVLDLDTGVVFSPAPATYDDRVAWSPNRRFLIAYTGGYNGGAFPDGMGPDPSETLVCLDLKRRTIRSVVSAYAIDAAWKSNNRLSFETDGVETRFDFDPLNGHITQYRDARPGT